MEGLFNPVSILLHILNAAILFTAVYFLLYKPVRKFTKAREDKIAGALDDAAKARAEAEASVGEGKRALEKAASDAEGLLADNRAKVMRQEEQLLENARAQAKQIIDDARAEADAIRLNGREEMRAQAAELAVEIARAVLEREVNAADHAKMIDEMVRKVG